MLMLIIEKGSCGGGEAACSRAVEGFLGGSVVGVNGRP